MGKIWIDCGHGGKDPGACASTLSRVEKNDNLQYGLELSRRFALQNFTIVMPRKSDLYVDLNTRTALERKEKCSAAISCHRNGSDKPEPRGFEIWLHSQAPDEYVEWAKDIVAGVKALGLPIREGQKIRGVKVEGVYLGYAANPKANYYANSGTNSPSMLIEFGFVSNKADNTFFDVKHQAVCEVIVKATCKFLDAPYHSGAGDEDTELKVVRQQLEAVTVALQQERSSRKQERESLQNDLVKLAEKYKL